MLAGVMGGIGEYFDVDPVILRLLYLIATIFTGVAPGTICYIIAMLVIPMAPLTPDPEPTKEEVAKDDAASL